MESKLLFKKIFMTKHKLKQNYQHTNKTQCPSNNDRWDVDKQFVVVIMIVGA